MPGFYGVIRRQTNENMFFCGNLVVVMATGNPFAHSTAKNYGPGFGHAFKFRFDVATNHVAAVLKHQPNCEAEIVPWPKAEKLAKEMALWVAGIEHPPIYVPGSRMMRVRDRQWHAAELKADGIEVKQIDQDISNAVAFAGS